MWGQKNEGRGHFVNCCGGSGSGLCSPWVQQCEQMVTGMSGVLYNPAASAVAAGPVGVFRGGGGSPAILDFCAWLGDRTVLSCPVCTLKARVSRVVGLPDKVPSSPGLCHQCGAVDCPAGVLTDWYGSPAFLNWRPLFPFLFCVWRLILSSRCFLLVAMLGLGDRTISPVWGGWETITLLRFSNAVFDCWCNGSSVADML